MWDDPEAVAEAQRMISEAKSMMGIPKLGEKPFRGVFIRAPAIIRLWNDTEPIAELQEVIVVAKQKHMLVTTFHPELTDDTRLHELFINGNY